MMAPMMSCGARLPVYALFAAAFFPVQGQNVVFVLYLIGILMAVLIRLLLWNSMLQGESVPFVMEMPAYHVPTLRGILTHTWERLKSFLIQMHRRQFGIQIPINLYALSPGLGFIHIQHQCDLTI